MRDSNQEYPLRQPQRGEHHPFDDFNEDDTLPEESHPRRGPVHQREQPMHPGFPPARVRKTLVISLVAGIIAAIINIAITIVNATLYQQGAQYAGKPGGMPINIAASITGLFCLTSFIGLIIYFLAGFIIGRVAVERRLGFFGGFVAGAITYVIGFIIGQLPNYPGKINSGVSGNPLNIGGGLIAALILLLLVALLGGLVGMLGARLATRRHPYYVGYDV